MLSPVWLIFLDDLYLGKKIFPFLPFWLGILNTWSIYIKYFVLTNDTIIVILITNLSVVFIIIFLIFLKELLKSLEFENSEWPAAVSRCTQRNEALGLIPKSVVWPNEKNVHILLQVNLKSWYAYTTWLYYLFSSKSWDYLSISSGYHSWLLIAFSTWVSSVNLLDTLTSCNYKQSR